LNFKSGLFFPFKYKNGNLSVISTDHEYHSIDIITEYFQEKQRMKARRRDTNQSPVEFWLSASNKQVFEYIISKNQDLTTYNLREALYATSKECTQFKSSLVRAVILLFKATSMLDFSAGWGDRLIGALGSQSIVNYVGVDPNVNLKSGHDEIINMLLPIREREYSLVGDFRIIYEPFQSCHLPDEKYYDLVFTSPPFFDFEIYTRDVVGQSIDQFPEFQHWVRHFLFVSLKKAWSYLKEEGHMVIHLTDIGGAKICEVMNLYIQCHLPGAVYLGLIGSIGVSTDVTRPMWAWLKKSVDNLLPEEKERSTAASRLIQKYYPEFSADI
jgi:hypothetical protein